MVSLSSLSQCQRAGSGNAAYLWLRRVGGGSNKWHREDGTGVTVYKRPPGPDSRAESNVPGVNIW